MRWTRTMTVLLIAAALAGCAAKQPKTVLREGARMVDLYRGTATAESADGGALRRQAVVVTERRCRWWVFTWRCEAPEPEQATVERPTYTRTAANELEFLFPRLANPDIYIYVLPHLATEARVPVPGYTTAVPLYERVEYALPGEVNETPGLVAPGTDGEEGTGQDAAPTEAVAPVDEEAGP